jgi:hypothetical protein
MHVKTSGIIAGGAFLLSFLVGLIGGAGFPMILVRALVFAMLFFVLSGIIHLVMERFLIDVPVAIDGDVQPAGSYVDISVADASDAEPSEIAEITDSVPAGIGEVARSTKTGAVSADALEDDLLSGALLASPLDQETKTGYTETTDSGADSLATHPPSDEVAELFANTAMPLKNGKLPDMESMADTFVEKGEEELFRSPSRKRAGKITEVLGKNYDPIKLAGAIKTVLQQK